MWHLCKRRNSEQRIHITAIMIWTKWFRQLRKAYQRRLIARSSVHHSMIAGAKRVARRKYRSNYFSRMTRWRYQTTWTQQKLKETKIRPMRWSEKLWVKRIANQFTRTSPIYSHLAVRATRHSVFSVCIIPTRSHRQFEQKVPRWQIQTSNKKTRCWHSSSLRSSKSSKTISRLATIRYLFQTLQSLLIAHGMSLETVLISRASNRKSKTTISQRKLR